MRKIACLILPVLLLFGCQKALVEKHSQGSVTKSFTVPPDVYVAGSEGSTAKYWKNGMGITLPGGSAANGIVVQGTDVHACGYGSNPATFLNEAVYWKNGVPTVLSSPTNHAIATGIGVTSTGDVYVCGRIGFFSTTAVYWLNGVEHSLGTGDPGGVVIDANDNVYIVNSQFNNPSYWVNGSLQPLPLQPYPNSYARALAVNSSGIVYVVGVRVTGPTEKALIWINNGTPEMLGSAQNSTAMAVAVNSFGSPVVSGIHGANTNTMHISYWPVYYEPPIELSTGRFVAASTGIAVDPTTDDAYICGSQYAATTPPVYAKYFLRPGIGGQFDYTLSDGSTAATALAITLAW